MSLGRDLRHALRTLRREPAFAAGVVLTFALAIGATAAMFGLVERLMLAPPPGVGDAGRVVRVSTRVTDEDGETFTLSTTSYPAFRAAAGVARAFAAVAAVRSDTMTVGRGAELAEAAAVQASGDYFAALGVRPALGRLFGPDDDRTPDGADVVVLGHAYWRRHFGGDPRALGRELVVDGRPFTVIGVAPRGFHGTELGAADLFVPLSAAMRNEGAEWWSNPGMRVVSVVARLREGVGPAAAAEMLAAPLRAVAAEPGGDRLVVPVLDLVAPGRSARESPQARIALWLSGVALAVLLLAAANVGTLLLLRAARRRRDSAVRAALGAGRGHLARQALVESLTLALAGAAVGLLLAHWFADAVRVTLLPTLAPDERVLNGRVLLASVLAAVVAGLLAGLGPLAQLRRQDLAAELRAGGHGSSGRFLAQHALVGMQVALCTVLLVGTGLFVRSLQRVRSQDLGFSTARLLYVQLAFKGRVPAIERDLAHEEAARRLRALPGVTGATVVQGMPFSSHHIPPIHVPGLAGPPNAGGQIPIMYGATPAYLEMMGVSLVAGRLLTERDDLGAPLVVLVNETFARGAWPDARGGVAGALGRCVRAGHGGPIGEGDPMAMAALLPCREVVGVVRDTRARSLRLDGHEARLMQYYVPFGQLPPAPFADVPEVHGLLVRTAADPARLAAAVQRLVQGTSAHPLYARVRPYQELLDPQLRSWRLGATLFSAFGALAAVGLFAVISYLVTQRTREIGVRLALGGSGAGVARLVVRDALRMVAAGAAAGLLAAMLGAPLVQSMLFQTSAREATIAAAAAGILLAVAVAAAAVPAWRASRVSPMTVLRTDT